MNDKLIDYSISILKEELSKMTTSLPDKPTELYRKIAIAFPKLIKSIGAVKAYVLKDTVIQIKCKKFTVFICRSKTDYNKIDIIIRKGGNNLLKKENVFFEDIERVIMTVNKSQITEYEVGDLDKNKHSLDKEKIGTNSSNVKNVATSISSAMSAVDGYPSTEKEIVANTNDRFEDLGKVINTSQFRSSVGDDKTYQKIKKNYATIKQN